MEDLTSQAETLQKLERLTNLETMVAEQRIRIEKYRTMYETLKAEHVQIEDAKNRRENELLILQDETQVMQKRFQEILNQARNDCDHKTQECEELRMQVLTPQKMEVLRVKLQEEAEASYKQKLETADFELDKYRSDFNKLRYEYSFLKSEYEHEQAKNKTMIEEQKAHHQIEIDTLTKDKEDLLEQLRKHEEQNDTQRIRMLQKDNTQLNLKVKSLLDELDEIREKREASGLQSDHVSRLQARQLSEISSHCKALETEKEALKNQLERCQAELERANKQQEVFSHQAMKFERENLQLKSHMDELLHNHKVDINNLKLSLTKDKGQLERERDTLQSELQTSKNKITVMVQNLDELKNAISRKEEEIVQRVQKVKEEEWEKISKLENYKIQAESQIAEYDRQKTELEISYKQQLEKMDAKLNSAIEAREKMDKELNSLKSQILQQRQQNEQLDDAKRQNQEFKTKNQKLMNDYESLLTNDQETRNRNEKLKDNIELLKKELKLLQEDMQHQQDEFHKGMQEAKKKIEAEKKDHEKEVKDVKKQLLQAEKKADKITLMAKKKHNKQKKHITELTNQVEVHKAQQEKSELEKNTLMKSLNIEHERTKRMLDRMRKRQNQFNNLLHASSVGIPNIALSGINQGPLLGMSFEPTKESSKYPLDSLDPLTVPPHEDDFINGIMQT